MWSRVRTQIRKLVPATADFKALTSDRPEGVVTRFMQDRLEILFWLRPPEAPGMIFGCVVRADTLNDLWSDALPDNPAPDYVIALLNDKARPVVTQPPKLLTSLGLDLCSRSQASCIASSASFAEPSMR